MRRLRPGVGDQRRITVMTHYSNNPGLVRADFFKPESGNWYTSEELDMSYHYMDGPSVYDAVRNALAKTRHGAEAEKRWIIVVLEPYHRNSYPVMLTPGRAVYKAWDNA